MYWIMMTLRGLSQINACCKYMECTNKGIRKGKAGLLTLEIWKTIETSSFCSNKSKTNWTWLFCWVSLVSLLRHTRAWLPPVEQQVLPTNRATTNLVNVENEKVVNQNSYHYCQFCVLAVMQPLPFLWDLSASLLKINIFRCPGSTEFILASVVNGVLTKGLISTGCIFSGHSQPGLMIS